MGPFRSFLRTLFTLTLVSALLVPSYRTLTLVLATATPYIIIVAFLVPPHTRTCVYHLYILYLLIGKVPQLFFWSASMLLDSYSRIILEWFCFVIHAPVGAHVRSWWVNLIDASCQRESAIRKDLGWDMSDPGRRSRISFHIWISFWLSGDVIPYALWIVI
jgi:hypothetical protein